MNQKPLVVKNRDVVWWVEDGKGWTLELTGWRLFDLETVPSILGRVLPDEGVAELVARYGRPEVAS